jgi:DNA-binding HxlR family transcriptional regulator
MSRRNTCVPDHVNGPEVCKVLDVLGRVSGKWTIGVLGEATRGPVRFTELERALAGVSRRMLTLTLRNLERDGLLVRTVYPTVPPKVEYVATDMARELYDHLLGLSEWAERHHTAIVRTQDAHPNDAHDIQTLPTSR